MTATNCRNWKHCGEGTLLHPITQHPVTTFVVEQEGWGRIGEWYDYGNDPEGTFDLILSAPKLRSQRDRLREALKCASELIPIARLYFPKSMHNVDKFRLENTGATINTALNETA